jgi:hypothetical protein
MLIGMMRSCQHMFATLIKRLDRDKPRAPAPTEVPPRAPTVIGGFHHELERVKFSSSWVPRKARPPRHGRKKMAMCFALRKLDLQHEGPHGGLQLKGSALLW